MEINFVHPDFPDARNFTEVVEQTSTSILARIEYPDGVVVLLKTSGNETAVSCNFRLIQNGSNVTIDTSTPNNDFVDIKEADAPFKPVYLNHTVTIPADSKVVFLTDTGENTPLKSVVLDKGSFLLMFKKYIVNSVTKNGSETLLKSDAPLEIIEAEAKMLVRIGHF